MRKISYAALADQAKTYSEQNTILSRAVSDLVAGVKPEAVEVIRDRKNGEKYTYRLFRSLSACGGYVIHTFAKEGQTPMTSVSALDDMRAVTRADHLDSTDTGYKIASAIGRLFLARQRLIDEVIEVSRAIRERE